MTKFRRIIILVFILSMMLSVAGCDSDSNTADAGRPVVDGQYLASNGETEYKIVIPENVTSLGEDAFAYCNSLEQVVIGSGSEHLYTLVLSLLGQDKEYAIESPSYHKIEQVYRVSNVPFTMLPLGPEGIESRALWNCDSDVLHLSPYRSYPSGVTATASKRHEYIRWAHREGRYIIEDDYNGELRYTARTLPAFQSKIPDKCIYIGSFSKLLLPSVRIAYMVLPDSLIEVFEEKMQYYNQTCGKTEQLALTEYILSGNLEKHLRRLRRIYYSKNQLMLKSLKRYPDIFKKITLFETSLIFEIKTNLTLKKVEKH